MSTILWPPLPSNSASTLGQQVDETRQRELSWLLSALQETLSSLKSGLEDCSSLLAPREQGSTLVVSSHRSEALKGFVTRNGSNITKGDIQLRLASLPPPRGQTSYKLSISTSPSAPALQVKQIAEVRTLINSSLDWRQGRCELHLWAVNSTAREHPRREGCAEGLICWIRERQELGL